MAPRAPRVDNEPVPESDRSGDLPHPREQSRLIGHRDAATSLAKAARSGQLHHAWLVSGPKGVGKATLAWRFARSLLAHGPADCPEDLHLDPKHAVFRQVASLTHPDVALVRRPWDADKKRFKTELPIDEVRRLRGFFSTHSTYGGMKVAIVDCMDDMNTQSQNALLKILEEPPKASMLLLLTHAPGLLLPTTRSRCRSLQLRKLADEDMGMALSSLCPELSPSETEVLLAVSDGAPGCAAFLASARAVPLYQDLLAVLAQLPTMNLAAQISISERLAKQPAETGIELFTTLMMLILQRMARASSGTCKPLSIEQRAFQAMGKCLPAAEWVDLWSGTHQQFLQADALNLDKKQFVLNVFYSIESALVRKAGAIA